MIHIGIIEDNIEIRENLLTYLSNQDEIKCHFAFNSFEDFFKLEINDLDILIVDIGLPGMSGIEGIELLKKQGKEIDIIIFTVYEDADKIFNSLCAGASAYLLKSTPLIEIIDAIKIIYSNGSVMSPAIARKVTEFFNTKTKAKEETLSDREQDVVRALVDGLSYKMIADKLNISIDTVRSHYKTIYKKLYINSKAELLNKAFTGQLSFISRIWKK